MMEILLGRKHFLYEGGLDEKMSSCFVWERWIGVSAAVILQLFRQKNGIVRCTRCNE